jgi:secernin
LRDHYEETFLEGPQFGRFLPDFHTLCMHDSPAGFTWGNTVTSVIIELDHVGQAAPVFWMAYLPPCSSVYTAFQFGGHIPEIFSKAGKAGLRVDDPTSVPEDEYDAGSLWWRLQRLVKELAGKSESDYFELRRLFDEIEGRHIRKVEKLRQENPGAIKEVWKEMILDHTRGLLGAIEEIEKELNLH